MLREFQQFAHKNELFNQETKILVACSGGIDSMVLVDLCLRGKINFGVAHCNFQLRGKESDEDESFIRTFCANNAIPFFSTSFKTLEYAATNSISTQMAARELRYNFFNEVIAESNFETIATAHHLDDQLESIIIKLIRNGFEGSPLGISIKTKNLIRPLLFANKTEIDNYATQNKLRYRTDSSNKSDKYLRNKIRHSLIPEFKSIAPGIEKKITDSLKLNQQNEDLLRQLENKFVQKSIFTRSKYIRIDKSPIIENGINRILLARNLRNYNFKATHLESLFQNIADGTGKIIQSSSHELLIDRQQLLLREIKDDEKHAKITFSSPRININSPLHLESSIIDIDKLEQLKTGSQEALFDMEKIEFPLTLRPWKNGDFFIPFGAANKKKVSDLLTDVKMNIFDKEQVMVLLSGEMIMWVIGIRTDHRFRITKSTKEVLKLKLL